MPLYRYMLPEGMDVMREDIYALNKEVDSFVPVSRFSKRATSAPNKRANVLN